MNTQSAPPSPATLLREADARMAQALDNFFQRSRATIRDTLFRSLATQNTNPDVTTGQACLEWLNTYPEAMSTAFADQFRRHLARPETFSQHRRDRQSELQLVDDDTLKRQLAEEKAGAYLTETLLAEMLLLFGRMEAVQRAALEDPELNHIDVYGPVPVVRSLSRALDALGIDSACGTFLLRCVAAPLLETLKQTYTALSQFLGTADIPGLRARQAVRPPSPRRSGPDAGQDVLAHIRSISARGTETGPAAGGIPAGPPHAAPTRSLFDRLADSPTLPPADRGHGDDEAPALMLRQLQHAERHAGTDAFDLAVLDAVAGLFEVILDDPGVSPRYKAEIAQLQIPALRVALVSPVFFSDIQHPARQLIDLMGLFSRRFPEGTPAHDGALERVRAASAAVLHDTEHPAEAFALAHGTLAAWMDEENARTEASLSAEVANLEQIEQQELGRRLALGNLHDLTERYPAPESVLRQLEAAWVPYMASLYVVESGEGPDWRAACLTLQNLFLSLQPPDSNATRETRLQSIPAINAALRRGLLTQGAEPEQMKDFFGAITATQECWIRPSVGQRQTAASIFSPPRVSQAQIEAIAHQLPQPQPQENDAALKQSQQLLAGDWVDFDPPHHGLATARVAWAGPGGHLLFCDGEGERHFSLDCERLGAEIRAGRVRIPEQSLTQNAMLRLKDRLKTGQA